MEDINNKRKLYNALKQEGYDNFKDENDFNSYVEDSNNRKKLFNALKQEGYDNFKDETAFDTYLGYGIKTSSPIKQNDIPSNIDNAKVPSTDSSYTDQQYEAWSKLTPDVRKTLIGNTPYYEDVERRLSDGKMLEKAGVGPKIHPDSVISGGVALPTDVNMVAERNYKDGIRRQLNQQIEESKQEANTLLGEVYNKDFEEKMKFQREHPFLAAMMNMKTVRTGVDTTHPRLVNEEAKNLHATINKLDDAKDVLDESARKGKTFFFGGLLRGVGKSVLDVRTWDSGTSDMLDSGVLLAAVQNKEAGRPLSHSQNLLLDAAAIDMAVDENFSGDLGRGYKAGRTTGESLPFMMEFLINPASGLGEATTKSIVKRGIQKYGKDAMKTTIKKIERGAMRAAADLAGAGIMSATTGSGRVVADTQERMLGNVQHEYDENGYVRYSGTDEGESLGTALAKSYGASVIENYSELLGNYFSPITDAITGVASRGLEKVGLNKVNKFIGDIKASDWGKAVADFEKRTHWNGNIGEYAEEVAGGIMNALVIGDQTLDTDSKTGVFNLDNNIDTLLGVSAIGGFLSGVRTIGYRTPKYKARKGLERADREAANVFGDDWTSVRESIESTDENDIIPVLSSIFQSEEYKPEQKTAAIKYASSLKNYQGANLADLRRKTDGDVNEVQLQTENSYDNGYGLATPQERNDAKIALEGTIGKLIESYPDINKSEEDVISTINSYGNTPTDVLMYLSNGANGEYSKEYISQVTDFLNAKAQYDGMIANVKDGMEGDIETQMDYITKNTHKDGNVYNATMKVDDRRVYVTGGNIVVGEDGMIDHQKSEKSIIIRDAQTGKVDMVDVRDIQSIQPGLNAEQHKAQIAEQIKQDYVEKAATDINGVLPFNIGDSYTILNPETGMREDVMVQQAEGDLITIVGNDGKEVQTTRDEVQALVDKERMMRFDEQQQKDSSTEYTGKKVLEDGRTITPIASNDTEVAFDILDREGNLVDSDIMLKEEYEALPDYEEIPEEELDDDGLPIRPSGGDNMLEMNLENDTSTSVEDGKMSEEPEEKVIDANNELAADGLSQETVTVPVQEDANLETMDTIGVQAQDVDQKPVIPVDEEGNPQYYKVPIETTIEDLTSPIVEEDGTVYEFTEEEVDGLIKVNKDEAIKRYEKLSGKPPKFVVNKVKYRAAKKQWTAQVADAKAQVDYWDEVEAQMKLLRQQPGDNTAEEIKAMGEPMNGEELAAMMLGAGKLPLLHSEYKRETGFGNTDASKMFGLFASKEKGGMTIEQAGEQLMLADLESGTNFFDQNDPNAGRNAIIDVLSSAQTRGGLIDYIKSNRDAMAERERRAEVEADELAKVQWYQDNYHMTPEEYELWEQGELLSESNVLSNDEKIEFYNTFADEFLNEEAYDSRREQSDGQSTGTSEGYEQGGISGLREGSHEVLQGEEPVSAGRAEGYQGEPAELAGQVDENLHSSDDGLQDSTSGRELNTSSESQEKVPEMTIPSRMEGEFILDYASRVNDANILHKQEQRVDTQPTEAQKEAGNYRKGHIKIDGFDITIENPKGSERSGVDADGKPWSVTMNNTYGYIRGTEGVDGDHIDVFLGNSGNAVYVVDQVKEDGTFDEHKVMYGFGSLDEARDAYLLNYSPGWKGLGAITEISKDEFKKWIRSSHKKTKPFNEYRNVKTKDSEIQNGNIRFREVKEKDGSKSLVGLHNISEEKLLKALNLGGFANPSAAVIDIDRQSHEGYGEISLVLPSALIEKRTGRNAGTWSTDAWTPTYPSVERSFKNNGSELLAKDLETMPKEMRLPVKRDFQNYMDGRDSDGLTYMFLYEKGVEPAIETVKNTYSDDIHKEIKEVTNNGTLSLFDLDKDGVKKIRDIYIKQEFGGDYNAFEESMKVLRDRWSSFLKEGNPNSFRYERFKQNLELMDEFGFDFSNVQSLISSVERDIDNSGKVDVGTTIKKAKTYVDENGLKGEFANWMESLNDRYGIEEVIFDGFTPSGKRRYVPNTLENVSKMMKKEGRNGATGIGVTFQNFAAGLLKAKAGLKDIRAEKKKLTSEQTDVDEFRDKWSKVFYDLGEKLQPDAKEYDDYGLYRLAEAAQSNNPQKYIKNEYGIDFPDEDVKQLNEMIEAIRNEYPAMYFETKFERPVYLNEFAAAVLPDNVSFKAMDAARNAGLQVFSYKSGDETSRNDAIKKASDIDGVRFREKEVNHGNGAEGQGENNASNINHKQIESQVKKISSVLHSPVRMIRNIEELPDGMARKAIEEGRNIKGWYDTRTGEVMIYLPNITGEEEAKATFLHEIVGHKGLRALLGEKEYDNEMVKLYGQLPLKVRKMVADAAVLDYGGDVAIAMDEYLAEQAEKNETPLWWNKVVSAIRGLLRKMGLNMKLSANDVKYLLWRSRKNLERSNLLSVAEDVAIRYKLGIGEYDNSLFQERYEDIKEEIDHLRKITGSNVYLARNEEELCFQMSVNGTDSKYIDYIRSLFERARGDGKKFPGFFDNKTGKIYLCADQINDRNKARGYWMHEEGHASTLLNFSRTELEMLYDSVGENRITETLPSVYFEEKLSKSTLADEYISFLMEEIASDEELFNSLLEGNVDEVLEELEFPSSAVIPFISDNFKTILYGKEKKNNRESGLGNGLRALSGEKGGDGNVKQPEDAKRESEEKSGSGRTDVGRKREETEGEGVRFREVPTEEDSGEQKRPTLLEAYKKHILELNSRISSLERKIDTYVSAEDLTGEVIEEIKKEIGSDIISEIGKGDLNSLMLQIKNAKTRKSLEKIFMNVKKIALAAQSRKLQRMLDKLLTLKVQDVNGKNMSIAKNVDESTRRVFSLIRGKLSDIKTSGLEDDILYLKRENRAAQEEIKRLERTIRDTDDAAVKDEAVSAIEKHKKTIEDNKGLIKELKDEKSELEKQIAGAADIDVEKERSALEEKMDRAVQGKEVWTQGDTERMAALNIIGGQIMNKSHDFEIESIESDIRNLLSTNSNLHKDRAKEASENKRRAIYNAVKENRRQIVALERLINDTRDMQVKQLQMTIEQLEELILNGKNSLLRQTQEEVKRKKHIIGQAIRTVEGKPIDLYDKKSSEEIRLKKFFSAPLGSFEYMCKRVNTKTLGKDGFLYKYFIEGNEGVMKAYDTYILGMNEFRERLDEKSKEIFGMNYEKIWSLSDKVVNESGVHLIDTGNGQRFGGRKTKVNSGYGVKYEVPLSKGQAMYVYQLWKMKDGRTKLELQGFDEDSIIEIRDFIGNDYIKFADWVQEELLPDLRDRYNQRYLEMFGTSMADIKDYVPIRIVGKSIRQESDLSEDKERKMKLEERAGSLIKRVVNIKPIDITLSAFDVLFEHGNRMEEWNAYARVRRDLDAVLSNNTFRNQLDANTRGSFHNFYDAAAVATKSYHPEKNGVMDEVIGKLSKGIVGGNIAWRLSTALKQILSAPAFWGYSQSPRYMKSLLTNTSKMPVTFKWCMENIPSFKERVASGTVGNEKLEENGINKILDKYIETGMIPNKLVDAITCSIGAKSIFDYRYGQLLRQGLEKDAARNQALMDADIYYNQTQQSSHPAFLSPMQMGHSIVDRMFTTYQNSNIGYVRKVLAAYYDLTRSLEWKKLQRNYIAMYMEEGMSEDEAERKAYHRLLNENRKTAFEAILFAWGMNLLWNIGSQGLLGFFAGDGDDDDNLSKGISFFLTSPIKGMPGGNLLESIASGYGMNPLLVYDELDKFMKEIKYAIDDYGLFSPEIAYATMAKVSRYAGVDLEVLANIYLGVEGLARDGALDNDKMIDFMYLLNSPKSNRAAVAKELYKDETITSFAEKVARAHKYIPKRDSWEGWVPGAKNLNKRRKKDIEIEYQRIHMTEEEKTFADEKKIADKHRRKLKELNDDPFELADYIDRHQKEHKIYQKYY